MKLLFLLILSINIYANYLVSSNISSKTVWSTVTKDKNLNIQILLNYLARSQTGRKILKGANLKAQGTGKSLIEVITEGETSLTDTTLYRKFNKQNPVHVEYEMDSIVKINKDLNQLDALLDLAHELTHYVYRDPFNPYRIDFTMKKFIKSTIEDKGGEVHAFITECNVLKELFPSNLSSRSNCIKIKDETDNFSYESAISQFYSVGNFYENFKKGLSEYLIFEGFEKVSNSAVKFISSAYGVPYPIAAFHEYNSVMKKVCENDLNRYANLKNDKSGRSIASVDSLKISIEKRCKNYL